MVLRRFSLLAGLLALSVACGGRSAPPRAVPPQQWMAQYERRADSGRAVAGDHGRAALVAWLVTGDARRAERHVARALEVEAGEPWAQLTRLLLAREALDDATAVDAALTVLEHAPESSPAELAAGLLREHLHASPVLDDRIGRTLSSLLAQKPDVEGRAALVIRETLLALHEGRSEDEAIADQQRALGIPREWTLVGPLSAWRLRDFDAPSPFDEPSHTLQPAYDTPLGAVAPRVYPAADGVLNLEAEPWRGDVYEALSDVEVEEGGVYLVSLRGASMATVQVDGTSVIERRALPVRPPRRSLAAVELAPGTHRLRVKLSRAEGSWFALALARADGKPAGLKSSAARIGEPRPPGSSRSVELPGGALSWAEAQLTGDERDPLAVLVQVLALSSDDPDRARERLDDLIAAVGESPAVRMLRVDLTRGDPDLPHPTKVGRMGRDLDAVLTRFAGWPRALELVHETERSDRRFEVAAARLDELAAVLGERHPRLLMLRARLALARDDAAAARRFSEAALDADPGRCDAMDLRGSIARRDDEVAIADRLAEAFARCPGGLGRLAVHRRQRGDVSRALELVDRLVHRHPASISPREQLAELRFAGGDVEGAIAALEPVVSLWPRRSEPLVRLAHFHELAGNVDTASDLRRLALGLDGSNLTLARSLSLDAATETLEWAARDGLEIIDAFRKSGYQANAPAVQVLDLGALEVLFDGSYVERIHSIVQVLDKRGIDRYGEVRLPGGAQPLVVRTIKPDGRLLDAEVIAAKESISMPNLEPGDFVEFEYLRATGARAATLPGFSGGQFFFRAAEIPFYESEYVVRVPAWMGLEVDSSGIEALPEPVRDGDHLVFRHTAHRVEPYVREPRSVSDGEVLPWVEVGTGAALEETILQMADWLPLRARPSGEVRALVRGTASLPPHERVRAIVDRVREAVRGASSSGDFRESAATIVANGRGNRMLVLKAALEAAGIPSRIVFVRSFGANPHPFRFPHQEVFSSPVLRIDLPGEAPVWMDFSLRDAPLGRLPVSSSETVGLVMPEGDEAQVARVTLPAIDPSADLTEASMDLALDEEGNLTGVITQTARGFDAAGLRRRLEQTNSAELRRQQEQMLNATFRGAELVELVVEDSGDPDSPVVARSTIRVPRYATRPDGSFSLPAHFGAQWMGARFVSRGDRETPLLLAQPQLTRARVELKLPPGWQVSLPEPMMLRTEFGRFTSRWTLAGQTLVLDEEAELFRARIAPAKYSEFRRYAGAIDAAQAREIPLRPR